MTDHSLREKTSEPSVAPRRRVLRITHIGRSVRCRRVGLLPPRHALPVGPPVDVGPTTFSLRGGRSPSHLPSSGVIRCKEPISGARISHPYRAVRSTNGSTPPLQLPRPLAHSDPRSGAVCTAAGVNPDHYRVWAHEGPEATAPATAGSTVAVTSWAVYRLPPQHLEAVLARELAHRLAIPRTSWRIPSSRRPSRRHDLTRLSPTR